MLVEQGNSLGLSHVAGKGNNGVVWPIVCLVELFHVSLGQHWQCFWLPFNQPAIGMFGVETREKRALCNPAWLFFLAFQSALDLLFFLLKFSRGKRGCE